MSFGYRILMKGNAADGIESSLYDAVRSTGRDDYMAEKKKNSHSRALRL